jgi:Uma2 family endonuclease
VADTSLAFDLGQKRALYSGADVPDYWIVDVKGQEADPLISIGVEINEA